jgi:hypothetical protein
VDPASIDEHEKRMLSDAVCVVLAERWLASQEVDVLTGRPGAVLDWMRRGEIFAIESEGALLFPRFGLIRESGCLPCLVLGWPPF